MVKKTVFETGFKGSPAVATVTPAVPGVARSAAVMVAVSCELLLNEVALSLLFQSTTELDAKFDPFTVNRITELPAVALIGEIELMCGVGGVLNVGPPQPGSTKLSPSAARRRRERCITCSLVGRKFLIARAYNATYSGMQRIVSKLRIHIHVAEKRIDRYERSGVVVQC
jgi:hypothetical protein